MQISIFRYVPYSFNNIRPRSLGSLASRKCFNFNPHSPNRYTCHFHLSNCGYSTWIQHSNSLEISPSVQKFHTHMYGTKGLTPVFIRG